MTETDKTIIKKNERSKTALYQGLKPILSLGLGFILTLSSAQAKVSTKLVNVFLADTGALIFETKDKRNIENFELLKAGEGKYKLVLTDTKIDKDLLEEFNQKHENLKIKKETIKDSFFKKQNQVSLELECQRDCEANFQPLLGGLAYQLKFDSIKAFSKVPEAITIETAVIEESSSPVSDFEIGDLDIEDKEFADPSLQEPAYKKPELSIRDTRQQDQQQQAVHLLEAHKKMNMIFELSKEASPVDEFLNDLDGNISNSLLTQKDFRHENISKADSASLSHIGKELQKKGHDNLSAEAYAKALEIDPENLNAMLGLARSSSNQEEKLHYYLKAIDDEALFAVGQKWFEKGKENGDQKQIAQAMISYQFAVLKNPENPYYRFEYGRVLEEAGYSNFEQASKRYLEAAVLAKKDFRSGDQSKEDILRKSTECLIKVLTKKGAPEKAVHYCNSYRALGFNKFLDGRSIKGVMKEISANKNPFQA